MKERRNRATFIGVVLLVLIGASGCEGDEFADAPVVQASSPGPEAESVVSDGEGSYGESAGPIQGRERPPDHPTLQGGQPSGSLGAPAPQVDRPSPSEYGKSGPIRWQAPADWQPQAPANQMRYAEYVVESDRQGDAELTVFYFGSGGGGVEDNLQRWAGQFDGDQPAVRDRRQVGQLTVHLIDVAGTYQTDMPMGGGEPRHEQRLLGAIAEASTGLYFFRLLGDQQVVDEQADSFHRFVDSLSEPSG